MAWPVADRSFSGSARASLSRTDSSEWKRWSIAARYSAYSLMAVAFFALLPRFANADSAPLFRENGPLEWLQVATIAVASGVLAITAARRPEKRALLSLLAVGVLVATIRELDRVWVTWIPWLPRKAPAIVGCACFIALAVRMRRSLVPQLARFVGTRGFALLWMGTITIGVFAQIVGSEAFLEALVGAGFERNYRRVVEEVGESFGGGIVLIGALETTLDTGAPVRDDSPAHDRLRSPRAVPVGSGNRQRSRRAPRPA